MINKLVRTDWILVCSVFLLLAISLTVLYSASLSTGQTGDLSIFWRQAIFALLGIFAMFFFSFGNYQILKKQSTALYFIILFVLSIVLIFGMNIRGTSGWIGIGSLRFQPVELAKLVMIIFMASFISQKRSEFGELGRVIISAVLMGVIMFLVFKQPDFGSAMVLFGIWIGMLFVSGLSRKVVIGIFVAILSLAFIGWFHLADYQKARINTFLDPSSDPRGSGYNVIQSTVAVGSGGFWGKGIGHGSQSQLNFLPEKHTDFIFAAIAEELGFAGSIAVLVLFFVIFYRIGIIAKKATDNFGYLLAIGVLFMIFLQMLENIGMNIGLMPVTGIPLPFLSYGGSSLVVVLSAMGIINNIHIRSDKMIVSEYQDLNMDTIDSLA